MFSLIFSTSFSHRLSKWIVSHLWHDSLTLEASADTVVDTLGLAPALTDAHEAVTLVTLEVRGACNEKTLSAMLVLCPPFS